ncbi:MAG: hypothetical protein OXB90_05290 [Acidimicrobiaceae bacterium]|nr:hypothetical protein [Acidimicrobiaceae bacterium]
MRSASPKRPNWFLTRPTLHEIDCRGKSTQHKRRTSLDGEFGKVSGSPRLRSESARRGLAAERFDEHLLRRLGRFRRKARGAQHR